MTPGIELDFDELLLQLSALRNDVVETKGKLHNFITKQLDPTGDGLLDPSLLVS